MLDIGTGNSSSFHLVALQFLGLSTGSKICHDHIPDCGEREREEGECSFPIKGTSKWWYASFLFTSRWPEPNFTAIPKKRKICDLQLISQGPSIKCYYQRKKKEKREWMLEGKRQGPPQMLVDPVVRKFCAHLN